MKKRLIFTCMILFLSTGIFGKERFMVSLTGYYLGPADSNYKDIYGKGMFSPEFKIGAKVSGSLYLWTGYGYLSAKGKTVGVFIEETKSSQHFLSFGPGYTGNLTGKLDYLLELGLFHARYQEQALGEEVTGSALGLRVGFDVCYKIANHIYSGLTLGYSSARDEVEKVRIHIGGFETGLRFIFRF